MIPEDITNNPEITGYTEYNTKGLIVFRAHRNKFGDDWKVCSKEEIDFMNKALQEANKKKYEKALKPNETTKVTKEEKAELTEHDLDEIEKAEVLLEKLRKEYNIEGDEN